jgi:predicted RNase H-like HicB family nuclease
VSIVDTYLLAVEVERLEDGRFLAVCPALQGCHAEGDSVAEALENLDDVARIHIQLSIERGHPLPAPLGEDGEPPVVRAQMVVKVGH